MIKSLFIGNLEIQVSASGNIEFSEQLIPFTKKILDTKKTMHYRLCFEQPAPITFQVIAELTLPRQLIGKNEAGEMRFYPDIFTGKPLAMYVEKAEDEADILLYREPIDSFTITLDDLNYFAIERQLMKVNNIILHSSFIIHDNKAILFSAPSGTGKSTQASLWEKCTDAKIMNGDRCLLLKDGDVWKAVGIPFCGSSGISYNGIFEIAGIIMIHQAPQNQCRGLSVIEAFKNTYPEITRNNWNKEFENTVLELINDLISNVRYIGLGCNMEDDAVTCLKKFLYNE